MVLLALLGRPNFYSAAIAIHQNSASLIIMVNILLIITLAMGKGIQLFFFGQLRALELEHLYERAFYALTESFLVLTVFKDEFTVEFTIFFITLLFLRVFHWIISDRVDLIFQTTQPVTWLTHSRLSLAILSFTLADFFLVRYCVMHIMASNTGTFVLFAFEFVLLMNSMMLSAGRYLLNVVEAEYLKKHLDEDNWEQKAYWSFVVDVSADSSRLLTYVIFFFVILKPYGLPPLHILRDVYITVMSLLSKVNQFIQMRKAQAAMDKEVLDATEEDLSRDNVCIICREEMHVGDHSSHRQVPKKLSCRHVIHYGCLKSWLARSQRCPTCRRPVISGENTENAQNPQQQQQQPNVVNIGGNGGNNGNIQPQGEQLPAGMRFAPPGFNGLPEGGVPININPAQAQQGQNMARAQELFTPGVQVEEPIDMVLQHHIEFPTGLQLPKGWGVLSARDSSGRRQVQIAPGEWADVQLYPSEPSSFQSQTEQNINE